MGTWLKHLHTTLTYISHVYIITARTKIPGHFGHRHVGPLTSKRRPVRYKANQFEYEYQLENNDIYWHLLTISQNHLLRLRFKTIINSLLTNWKHYLEFVHMFHESVASSCKGMTRSTPNLQDLLPTSVAQRSLLLSVVTRVKNSCSMQTTIVFALLHVHLQSCCSSTIGRSWYHIPGIILYNLCNSLVSHVFTGHVGHRYFIRQLSFRFWSWWAWELWAWILEWLCVFSIARS